MCWVVFPQHSVRAGGREQEARREQAPGSVLGCHTVQCYTVDSSLKFHEPFRTVQKAGLAQNLLKSTACSSPEFMGTLFCTRPILEYCSNLQHTGYIVGMQILESVQRCWTKRISSMSHLGYSSCLRSLNMYLFCEWISLACRGDILLETFHCECCISAETLFSPAPHFVTRWYPFKVGHARICM